MNITDYVEMSATGERVITPGRYTPPILRSSKPEVLPSNHVERQRVQAEIERMRLQDTDYLWKHGEDSVPGVCIDDLGGNTRDLAGEDDGTHSVMSEGSGRISSCHSVKKVSFRRDNDLEEVREIPCREKHKDITDDSDSDCNNRRTVISPRKKKKALTPTYHKKDAFPVRRAKSGTQTKLGETQRRANMVKSAPASSQGRHTATIKNRASTASKNSSSINKLSTGRHFVPLLSPLLHINAKTISDRKKQPQKNTFDHVHKQGLLPQKDYGAELELASLPHAFDNCSIKGDSETNSYIASQRMHAWHIANTCDFSEFHSPQIVPLWEKM